MRLNVGAKVGSKVAGEGDLKISGVDGFKDGGEKEFEVDGV